MKLKNTFKKFLAIAAVALVVVWAVGGFNGNAILSHSLGNRHLPVSFSFAGIHLPTGSIIWQNHYNQLVPARQNGNGSTVEYQSQQESNCLGGCTQNLVVAGTGGGAVHNQPNTNPNYNTVVDTLVASHPVGVLFDPINNDIYVANNGNNTVEAINTSNQVIGSFPAGTQPWGMAVNTNNGDLYVGDDGNTTVTVLNSNNNVVDTIQVGTFPDTLAFDPQNGNIYCANDGNGTISVINSANHVIDTINVGGEPFGITFNPVNNDIYVTNNDINGTVDIINSTNNIVSVLTGFNQPEDVIFNPNNNDMYVLDAGDNFIKILNSTNQISNTINLVSLVAIVFDPVNNEMYVTQNGNGTVSDAFIVIINSSNQIIDSLHIGDNNWVSFGIDFSPKTGDIYFSATNQDKVGIIDARPTIP